jgi:hypothetical protein
MNWNLLVGLYNAWQLRQVRRSLAPAAWMPEVDCAPEVYVAGGVQGPQPAPPPSNVCSRFTDYESLRAWELSSSSSHLLQ